MCNKGNLRKHKARKSLLYLSDERFLSFVVVVVVEINVHIPKVRQETMSSVITES